MPTICPSIFRILIAPPHYNPNPLDLFQADRFIILNHRNLTYVKTIISYVQESLDIRLLCCHHVKNETKNYCVERYNTNVIKCVCDKKNGNETKYLHFHILLQFRFRH